jgi:hypothetical protein
VPLDDECGGAVRVIVLEVDDDSGKTTVLRRDLEAVTPGEPVTPDRIRSRKPSLAGTGHRSAVPRTGTR